MSSSGAEKQAAVEEAGLMAQFAAGDTEAPVTMLYTRYGRRLFAFGMQQLGDAGLAEEMVQETFVRLWRTAGRFDAEKSSVGTYLYVIARSVAADIRERPSSRPLIPVEAVDVPPMPDSVDQILQSIIVREAIDALGPAHAEVLRLAHEEGLTQQQIAERLGLPLGTVKTRTFHGIRALRTALIAHGLGGAAFALAGHGSGSAANYSSESVNTRRDIQASDDFSPSGGSGESPGSGEGSQPPPEPGRYLVGELPSRIQASKELSVIISITSKSPESGLAVAPLPSLNTGPQGIQVTIVVRPDAGLRALGELQQTMTVPQYGDPPPLRFSFRAQAVGLSRIRVTSWLGGTFLAELQLEVSVESGRATAQSQLRSTAVGELRPDPGEVTLQVHSDGSRYSFQLLSQRYLFGPVMAKSLTEEPGHAVERTVAMLRKMASDTSGYTPGLAARWVRETGTGLWQDLVPKVIQDQFWELRDSISSFNIACDDDKVPWELLYPLTRTDDAGFLIEQFPVLRRVYDQCRSDWILLGDAQYVVPPGSPENAREEVAVISQILRQPAGTPISNLADLLGLLDAGVTGLLHFACHNTFSLETGGSSIKMVGGAFMPQLLNSTVGRRCLADRSPLIFINACRSAGTSAEYTRMMGWASQFMAAGAGAFIGTLWPVRSSQASLFAEAFYSYLMAGDGFGQAILAARQAAKDDADPTWLAYTAYGDPAARSASRS